MFKKAGQASPSIIFLDEFESIGAHRSANSEYGGQVNNRMVDQLLTCMDGVESLDGVVIVAATNRPEMIDKALLRSGRFERVLHIPPPDEASRREILSIHSRKMPIGKFNIEDFAKKNYFHRVLTDHAEIKEYGLLELQKDKKIKKVILCSGKIYFDLLEGREKAKNDSVFFIRIEQLYPFPVKTLAQVLKRFRKNAKFYWCQEEPQNMGAWNSARNYIEWSLNHIKASDNKVRYIGRKPAASPATGYLKKHLAQQKEIIEKVLS